MPQPHPKKLSWVFWGLLWLVIAVVLFCTFYVELQQDPAYRETMGYVTLVITGGVVDRLSPRRVHAGRQRLEAG